MQRSLAMVAVVVVLAGLGVAGYEAVTGEAGEAPPVALAPSPSPGPQPVVAPTRERPRPIPAPTRAPRPEPTPSPTPPPDPTPSPLEPVPVERPAGNEYTEDEYRAIYEEHQVRASLIGSRPNFDPDDLALFFTPECQCWNEFHQSLVEDSDQGVWTDGVPAVVLHFDLISVEEDGSFVARVIDQRQPGVLRANDGTVLEEYTEPSEPFEREVRITPTPEGWRTTGQVYITDLPEQSS